MDGNQRSWLLFPAWGTKDFNEPCHSHSLVWLLGTLVLNAKQTEGVVCSNFLSVSDSFFAVFCLLGSFALTTSPQLSMLETEGMMLLLFHPLESRRAMPPNSAGRGPPDRLVARCPVSCCSERNPQGHLSECCLHRAWHQLLCGVRDLPWPHRGKSGTWPLHRVWKVTIHGGLSLGWGL